MTKFSLQSWEEEQASLTAITCFVRIADDAPQERLDREQRERGDVPPDRDTARTYAPDYDLGEMVSSFFDTLLDSFHTPQLAPSQGMTDAVVIPSIKDMPSLSSVKLLSGFSQGA